MTSTVSTQGNATDSKSTFNRNLKMLWLGLIYSFAIYFYLLYTHYQAPNVYPQSSQSMVWAMYAMAAFSFIAIFVLPSRMRPEARARGTDKLMQWVLADLIGICGLGIELSRSANPEDSIGLASLTQYPGVPLLALGLIMLLILKPKPKPTT